jgi:LuxR family maltose regulon positive regulatory protein
MATDDPSAQIRPASILGLAHFRAGHVSEAGRAFSQAIAATQSAGLGFAAVPLVCNLAEVERVRGQLRQSCETYDRAIRLGTVEGRPTSSVGFAEIGKSRILYEWNELELAERHVSKGLELLVSGGVSIGLGMGYGVLACTRQAMGDPVGALDAIQQTMHFAEQADIPRLTVEAAAYRARIWLAQGLVELCERWAQEYLLVGATEYLREFEDLTLVRVRLAQDRFEEASRLVSRTLQDADSAGRMGTAIEALALQALALQAAGDRVRAQGVLERALILAEPEGYVRTFVEGGTAMAPLLHRACAEVPCSEYAHRLLAYIVQGTGSKTRMLGIDTAPSIVTRQELASLVEPLTDREIQVLHLLAEGLSNAEIARRLVISLPTVKSHTRNIYGKLEVHSRRDAVARARSLGILPAT